MRTERDSMGEMQVPDDAYYGASTQRAVENFPISNLRLGRRLIAALGMIKSAAAEENKVLGIIPPRSRERSGVLPKRWWPAPTTDSSCSTCSKPGPAPPRT